MVEPTHPKKYARQIWIIFPQSSGLKLPKICVKPPPQNHPIFFCGSFPYRFQTFPQATPTPSSSCATWEDYVRWPPTKNPICQNEKKKYPPKPLKNQQTRNTPRIFFSRWFFGDLFVGVTNVGPWPFGVKWLQKFEKFDWCGQWVMYLFDLQNWISYHCKYHAWCVSLPLGWTCD